MYGPLTPVRGTVLNLGASRLGRRPKRLKDVSGESTRAHTNLPIAPYPSAQEMQRRKALRATNGTYEHILEFREAERQSFREHAKTDRTPASSGAPSTASSSSSTVVQVKSTGLNNISTNSNNINTNNNSNKVQPSSSPVSALTTSALGAHQLLQQQQQQHQQHFLGVVDGNSNALVTSAPPSPFTELNLGLAELSPMEPSMALSLAGGSGKTPPSGTYSGVNGNGMAYSPGPNTDTMPSPLGIPSIDQMDLESPSTFLTFNTNSVGGRGE
ncbi:hypothetical protein EGW08_008185 [Elysia chlorotica]|uniref:Uncharacterized protein n=1 Tax=Elysia chlorotica TaxID=188477 RepID=A0A433TR22_ELYCH|nr:hypothetical protein EGW08_008185 [Elysia chlorotica]